MPLKPSAQKVQEALVARGFANTIVELPDSTRTAADAAAAIGCEVAQIVKSLVFRGRRSGAAVLVATSGTNRVDERKVKALLDEDLERASADFVREQTGFAIGGVPPIGHARQLLTLVDEDLFRHERIWAAGGHPNAVFELTPSQLVAMSEGRVAKVS